MNDEKLTKRLEDFDLLLLLCSFLLIFSFLHFLMGLYNFNGLFCYKMLQPLF